MGMVDDSSASRDSYFYDSPHRCDPEKNRYSYPIICHERYRAEGEVSQFGALTTALASTIGTGNIIGVGTAIALGGPGAG